jgi:hypothetical protein
MTTTHILKMKCGITCTMLHDETTGRFACTWSPPPPLPEKLRKQILGEYEPWRDGIIEAWAERTGRTAVVVKLT